MTETMTEPVKKPCNHCGKGNVPANAYGAQNQPPRSAAVNRMPTAQPIRSAPFLPKARIYVAACKDSRIEKLPAQLAKLKLPYTLEKEQPTSKSSDVYFDPPSRRFRKQCLTNIYSPLLWLEDDIDIPDDFLETWSRYEKTLPADWLVAVLGWGLIYDNEDIKIRRVTDGWWHLEGGTVNYGAFSGAQAVLVNSGTWRMQLADKQFRCDVGLCAALKSINVTQIYHADTVLIGTNDPLTTFGNAVVLYEKMSQPRYFGWKTGYRAINENDFMQQEDDDRMEEYYRKVKTAQLGGCAGCGSDERVKY